VGVAVGRNQPQVFFMAKELPYFKFEPGQWDTGNIQLCSFEAQGAFISICSIYWQRLGDLKHKFALMKVCKGNDALLKELIDANVIKQDGDDLTIFFLDQQLEEFQIISNKRSEAGKKGGENRFLSPEIARVKGNQIYVIHCFDESEEFIKVGITSDSISRRFSGKIPYNYTILFQFSTDEYLDLESLCNDAFYPKYGYKPEKEFIGYLECFNMSVFNELNGFIKHRTGNAIAMPKQRNARREEEKRVEKKKGEDSTVEVLPFESDQFAFAWNEWVEYRKEKKQKLTQKTKEMQLRTLGARPESEAIGMIGQSIQNGWTGLFEFKNKQNGKSITAEGTRDRLNSYRTES